MSLGKSGQFTVDCATFIPLEADHTSIPESVKAQIMRDALLTKQRSERARKLQAERRKSSPRQGSDEDEDDDYDDQWNSYRTQCAVDLLNPYAVNPLWYKPLIDALRTEDILVFHVPTILQVRLPDMARLSKLCRLRAEFQSYLLSRRIEQLFNTLGGWYITHPSKTNAITSLRLERSPETEERYLFQGQPAVELVKKADETNPFSTLRLLTPCESILDHLRRSVCDNLDQPTKKLFKILCKQLQTSPCIEFSWDEWTRYVVPRLKHVHTQWLFAPDGMEIRWDEKAEWEREKVGSNAEDSEIEVATAHRVRL